MTYQNNVLCIIDIQKEYITPGRPFFIEGIEPSLHNAKNILDHARLNSWKIIHVKHLQSGNIFSDGSPYSEFIEAFEPKDNEIVCVKNKFSSFSSSEFSQQLKDNFMANLFLIGYGSTMCCMSTIIDGHHRGFNFTFVKDASYAKPTNNLDSETLHLSATEILQTFCRIESTENILK